MEFALSTLFIISLLAWSDPLEMFYFLLCLSLGTLLLNLLFLCTVELPLLQRLDAQTTFLKFGLRVQFMLDRWEDFVNSQLQNMGEDKSWGLTPHLFPRVHCQQLLSHVHHHGVNLLSHSSRTSFIVPCTKYNRETVHGQQCHENP